MGKKFRALEHTVEKEYLKKGYTKERADYIGKSVAGRVYRNKKS